MKRFQMITEADARVIEYGSTVTLEARVSVSDGRKTTGRLKTTIKAPKRKRRG